MAIETMAEKAAHAAGDDGQAWFVTAAGRAISRDDGEEGTRHVDDVWVSMGAVVQYRSNVTRYAFADGSAIVELDGAWDVEGTIAWSWQSDDANGPPTGRAFTLVLYGDPEGSDVAVYRDGDKRAAGAGAEIARYNLPADPTAADVYAETIAIDSYDAAVLAARVRDYRAICSWLCVTPRVSLAWVVDVTGRSDQIAWLCEEMARLARVAG